MSAPQTSKQLAKIIEENRDNDNWSPGLLAAAERALLTLRMIEMNPQHVIDALKLNAPSTWAGIVRDLVEFAEKYGAWEADRFDD